MERVPLRSGLAGLWLTLSAPETWPRVSDSGGTPDVLFTSFPPPLCGRLYSRLVLGPMSPLPPPTKRLCYQIPFPVSLCAPAIRPVRFRLSRGSSPFHFTIWSSSDGDCPNSKPILYREPPCGYRPCTNTHVKSCHAAGVTGLLDSGIPGIVNTRLGLASRAFA